MIHHDTQPYGEAALIHLLRESPFPISKHRLITQYGHKELQWTPDRSYKLRTCLLGVGQREFRSVSEVSEAIRGNLRWNTREAAAH